MGDLDDQLREALGDNPGESDTKSSSVRAPDSESSARSAVDAPGVALGAQPPEPARNLGLLAALLIAAGGILALVFTSVDGAAIYSVTTDQLVQQKDKYQDRNVRVEGDLVAGTLTFRKEPCEYRFTIEKNGEQLEVQFPECVVPDTLKDSPGVEVQVTAEGSLNPAGYFDATHIMAKCPSKYEMKQRAANGEKAPHSMGIPGAPVDAEASDSDAKKVPALDNPFPSAGL